MLKRNSGRLMKDFMKVDVKLKVRNVHIGNPLYIPQYCKYKITVYSRRSKHHSDLK